MFEWSYFTSIIIGFIIAVAVFVISYSIFNIVISQKKVASLLKKSKVYSYLWSSIAGVIIALITLLSLIDTKLNYVDMQRTNIFLIANIFIYAITFNVIVGYAGILTCSILNIILFTTNNISFFDAMNGFLLLGICLLLTFISYIIVFKNNMIVFAYILTMALLINLNILIEVFHKSTSNIGIWNIVVSNIALFLYLLLTFVITKPFAKFISNAKNINEKTYMKDNFIIQKFYKQFFYNFVTQNNTEYGILFVIDFNLNKELTSTYTASFIKGIKLRFIEALRLLFNEAEVLYFLTKEDNYAFFIKQSSVPTMKDSLEGNDLAIRHKQDTLRMYEEKFKTLPFDIMIDDKVYHRQFKFVASYYGVQSNNIEELCDYCDANLHLKHKNMIYLTDLNQTNTNGLIEKKKNKILLQENFFDFNEVKVKENDLLINNKHYQYFTPFAVEKLLFSWNDFLSCSNNSNVQDAIVSHISSLCLKQAKTNSPIIINYHQATLMNMSFSVDEFITKIQDTYHVKEFAINIIMNNSDINKTFIENIQKLKKYGVKCFIHTDEDYSKLKNWNEVFKIKTIKSTKNQITDNTPNFVI